MKNILYIGFNHGLGSHDLSLSMVSKNIISSISLERLYRIKQAPNIKFINNKELYHSKAIDLLISSVDFDIVDEIVVFNYPGYKNFSELFGKKVIFKDLLNHHYLHSASSFFASNRDLATVLSVDGCGPSEENGIDEMQTIRSGKLNSLRKLFSTQLNNKRLEYGIGTCYYMHSDFVGLSEGTFMGLSSYGDANRFKDVKIFDYKDGNVYINKDFLRCSENEFNLGLFNNGEYTQFYVIKNIMKIYGVTEKDMIDRKRNITNSIFADIAAKVQLETENAMVYLAKYSYKLNNCDNLCLSGGVALNCLANTKILRETNYKNIFVQPACSDQGLSLGAAFHGYYNYGNNTEKVKINNYGIGPSYTNSEIEKELRMYKDKLKYKRYDLFSELIDIIGTELNNNKIIAFFQGGSEFGARALGFRSILSSPKSTLIRDKVNDIKLRERWRPLAPVVLEDCLSDFFDTNYPSPYMTFVGSVKKDKRDIIPGVVHIDGTARYQTVNEKENFKLYKLIENFYMKSQIPILINTSFNSAGEPIIENPRQAIEMFLSTQLDYLVIGDFIVSKSQIYNEYKFDLNNYKLNELKKYGRNSALYFKEVYLKIWKVFFDLLFENDINVKISYQDLFNDYIIEFNYDNDIVIITFGYHNYFDYYFYSILGLAVKGKNKYEYSDKLKKKLDLVKENITKKEKDLMYYFDKFNNEFYERFS